MKLWGIVDGVYRLRGPGQAWLRGLLQLLQPELERGLGMGAYFFDARASPAFVTSELTAVGVGRVDDRRPLSEAAAVGKELDRPHPVLCDALLDLARLLVGVHVQP